MRCCASSASGSIRPSSMPMASRRCSADPLFLDVLRADEAAPFLSLGAADRVPAAYGWWASRACPAARRAGRDRAVLAGAADRAGAAGRAGQGWRRPTACSGCARSSRWCSPSRPTLAAGYRRMAPPADFDAARRRPSRARGCARSADPGWRFPGSRRVPICACPPGPAPPRRRAALEHHLSSSSRRCAGSIWASLNPAPAPLGDALSSTRLARRPGRRALDPRAQLRHAEHQRPVRQPLLDHAAVAPLHHRASPHVGFLCLPDFASRARLSRRDVQRRRHRLGQ